MTTKNIKRVTLSFDERDSFDAAMQAVRDVVIHDPVMNEKGYYSIIEHGIIYELDGVELELKLKLFNMAIDYTKGEKKTNAQIAAMNKSGKSFMGKNATPVVPAKPAPKAPAKKKK